MSWLDSNPGLRAELRDAGRLGNGRFEGPEYHYCPKCRYLLAHHKDGKECPDETTIRMAEGGRY
jgi:ssDNA-binding Zn-finger/Zn-ribbon topoisomerase 1